jgi:hypothetical protein
MTPLNHDISNGNDNFEADNVGSAGAEQDRDASLAQEGVNLADDDLRAAAEAAELRYTEWPEAYQDEEPPRAHPRDEIPLAPELEAVHERRRRPT